jgi:hypothetical protein
MHHNLAATLLAPTLLASTFMASTNWIASLPMLRLVVYGSLGALALAVVVLLLIWWHEWRSGKAWCLRVDPGFRLLGEGLGAVLPVVVVGVVADLAMHFFLHLEVVGGPCRMGACRGLPRRLDFRVVCCRAGVRGIGGRIGAVHGSAPGGGVDAGSILAVGAMVACADGRPSPFTRPVRHP